MQWSSLVVGVVVAIQNEKGYKLNPACTILEKKLNEWYTEYLLIISTPPKKKIEFPNLTRPTYGT